MPQASTDTLSIAGTVVDQGTRAVVPVRITEDLDGREIVVWVHAINGSAPGPVLGLIGTQHGDEWKNMDMIRHAIADLDPSEMKGAVLAVPVCNPPAFAQGERIVQPESDGPDMNRVWPGHYNWIAESITKVISAEVLSYCDAVMDFHLGPWGSAFYECFYGDDYPNPEVVRKSRSMALAFGMAMIGAGKVVTEFPGPRSLAGYAGTQLQIPSLGVELGGAGFGFELERTWTEEGVRGVRNIMRHMGILDEPLDRPHKRVLEAKGTGVRLDPPVGGLLIPEHEPEQHLRRVNKGELLGRVVSPHTFEELAEIISPIDGYLIYFARTYPIRPGHWTFGLHRAEDSAWIDVD